MAIENPRRSGIDIIGQVSWGAHFCQFYQTKEDLLDFLVPYFKAGLESNEFCMWVTSEPVSEKEAMEAMRKAMPDFDKYLSKGQIEIIPYTEWYLKGGSFNAQRVLEGWVNKLNSATAFGYDGLRLSGNTFWLEQQQWKSFAEYEARVDDAIGKYRIIALCTYSLEKCSSSEIIDVVRNHQFAIIKRRGKWELIESSEHKKTEETLKQNYEIQCAINSFLYLSLQDISLAEFFRHSLELILSIPGLSLKPKGSIFIVGDNAKVLVMKSQIGLSASLKKECAHLPLGKCLCSQAVETKKIQFIDSTTEGNHQGLCKETVPHGHYCVPIISHDKALGVINLYLKEGYQYNKRDEVFLTAIAYTLAGVIERKNTEDSLKKLTKELESQVAKRTSELVEANKLLIEDVAERQQIEKGIRISNAILKLLSKMNSRKEYLEGVIKLIRGLSGCRYAGIRLKNEKGNIPYEAYIGFSKKFWESENWLSVNRDNCACIRVITGRPLPQDSPAMTKRGSFHCDNAIEFLSGLSEKEDSKFRTGCVCAGFTSIAIIPISYKNKVIGAIHLADKRESRIGTKVVGLIESLTLLIGEGIRKFDLSEEVLQTQKELADAKRLSDIGALGAVVAHELRNPLAAIRMAAYNIKRKTQNPTLDKHFDNIEKKVSESSQIIDNLLFYSHLKMPQFEVINMEDILNECIDIVKSRDTKNKVLINKRTGFIKNIPIEADPLQMKELFANILNNSFDSILNRGKIKIGGSIDSELVNIYINDNGMGMDAETLKKAFEPFFTTKAKGVGLGLTVCYQIAQLHEGAINIASEKNKGTTISVTLPITRKQAQS